MFVPVMRAGRLEVRRKRPSWRTELVMASWEQLSDITSNTTGTAAFNNIIILMELVEVFMYLELFHFITQTLNSFVVSKTQKYLGQQSN